MTVIGSLHFVNTHIKCPTFAFVPFNFLSVVGWMDGCFVFLIFLGSTTLLRDWCFNQRDYRNPDDDRSAKGGASLHKKPDSKLKQNSFFFVSFKKKKKSLLPWYLSKVNSVLSLQKGTVIVLLEPMKYGYLRLFDTIINYLSCYIRWQYTV